MESRSPLITDVCNKANKTLDFLRRNIKTTNQRLKNAAYKTFVRPVLEYASPVWDPFTANNIKALEKVQRQAVGWVKQNYRRSACEDTMRQQLHRPALEKRRKQARLTTFYKFHHGLIHTEPRCCPSKSDHTRKTTGHTHNLTYDIPSHRTACRQMTFFPRTIPEWNSLPQEVTTAPTPGSFSRVQGLLPAGSLTSINEKWISEGRSCAGWGLSPGTATVAGLV